MTETTAPVDLRRHQIPSRREVEMGEAAFDFRPLELPQDETRFSARQQMRRSVAQLDPRAIVSHGPAVPLALLFAGFVFTGWDESAFSVLLKEIQDSFHFELGYILVLGSLVQAVTFLLVPVTGYLADRVRRVRMLALGAMINGASVLASGAAPSVAALTGARTADGLSAALSTPAGYPTITDWYPPAVRARVFAVLGMGTTIGAMVGPSVAGGLGSLFGWRTAFYVLGALPLLVGIGFLTLKEPVRGGMDRRAMGADAAAVGREQTAVGWAEGWRAARSISTLRRLWYAAPFLTAAGSVLNVVLSLYFADVFGVSPFERGLIGTLTGSFGLVGLAISGPLTDRLLQHRPGRIFTLLGAVLALNCVFLVALVFAPILWVAVLVAAPLGLGVAVAVPALFTLVSMVVPARIRGFGIMSVGPWQVLGLVMVILMGEMGRAGSIRSTMLLIVPVFAIGAAIIGTAGGGVDRDIRAARAASMADEESRAARARGVNKMLICRDVGVTYEGTQVLFNVDFDLEEGELVAVLGTNGAGKSTLLRAVCGLQEASAGAVFLDGEDVTHRPAHLNAAAGVVYMPGGQAVFPSLTVAENLRAAGWLDRRQGGGSRTDEADASQAGRLDEVMGLFPVLGQRMEDRAGDLSGGEQQMVALAQALLMRPRLLMIDELSLGLAPSVVQQLLEVVERINQAGTTVVLVEQSVNVALTIARRAVFLDKGEIRFDGPTTGLLGRPELVRSVFLGGAAGRGAGVVAAGGPQLIEVGRPGPDGSPRLAEPTGPILQIRDLAVSFGGRRVLDGVSLEVSAGEVVGIIGPNGAGKTTLFDAVSGYAEPEGGTVLLDGRDLSGAAPDDRARTGLGRSFQNARLFPSLTVRENVAVALEMHLASRSALGAAAWLPKVRRSERRAARRVDYLIDALALDTYADKFVGELSTGTRRIVDVACLMASEPKMLLLDEPSSGLAQAEVEVMAPMIRRLARVSGCGVLVIEHDLPLVTAMADRLMAMELGRIVAAGRPEEVTSHPRVVESYLGASSAVLQRSGPLVAAALSSAGLVSNLESADAGPDPNRDTRRKTDDGS